MNLSDHKILAHTLNYMYTFRYARQYSSLCIMPLTPHAGAHSRELGGQLSRADQS